LISGQVFAGAGGTTPGSADDPIVTKSYVDQQLAAIRGGAYTGENSGGGGGLEIKVVTLQPGQRLIAKAGSEFIVRNGNVLAIGSAGGGIPDVTAGTDLANGVKVPTNHQLIFPRDDGRGIHVPANQKGVVNVMVRGGFEVK
jgi:hypothetical protein